MYFKLNSAYVLKGYKGIPYTLANIKNSSTLFLNGEIFKIASFCDGETPMEFMPKTVEQQKFLDMAVEKGIIEELKEPSSIEDYQRYQKVPNRYLRSVHWSVTGKCNLKCRHCYISAPDYKFHDLDTEECFKFIDDMQKAGVINISVTGGELFVRKDIFDILEKIIKSGMGILQVYTNGLLLNQKILDWFKERSLNPDFVLSHDGVGCHDWMRGVDNVEKPTVDAIKLLKANGFRVAVESAICRQNIDSLVDTYEELKRLKVDYWKTSFIFDVGRWAEREKDANERPLTHKELYAGYLKVIERYVMDGAPMSVQFDGFFAGVKGQPQKYESPFERFFKGKDLSTINSCATCRIHPYLLPDGKLIPCPAMTETDLNMPNLMNESLSDIYSNDEHPFFKLTNMKVSEIVDKNKSCSSCKHKENCGGGCRALSVLSGNGIYGSSPILCEFFNSDYRKTIKDTVDLALKNS